MRLVFDTESSGLRKADLPADHPSQPNLVQLGAVLFDGAWKPVGKYVSLIRPDGWSIEPAAEAHHGISEARCAKFGVPVKVALVAFQALVANALQIIAHNAEFDRGMIAAELARAGADGFWWRKKAHAFACSMELSTIPCGLQGQFGPKFPSLEEAHRRFYPAMSFSTAHDAESDLMAAARIAQALERDGILPAPALRSPAISANWRKS